MACRNSNQYLWAAWASLMALILNAGCGDAGPKTTPVVGKVTIDAQPLAKGSLRFVPDTAKGNKLTVEPAGTIENGNYTIFTNGKPGAPVGAYKVAVVATVELDSTNPTPPPPAFDPKFGDPQKSPLSVDVAEGAAAGKYDFQLTK